MRGASSLEVANKRAAFLAATTNGKIQNSFPGSDSEEADFLVVTKRGSFPGSDEEEESFNVVTKKRQLSW
jgi:hypothetical protein